MNSFFTLSRSWFGKFSAVWVAAISPLILAAPEPEQILLDMKRVADWQITDFSNHAPHSRAQAPFFLALINLYQVSGDARYLQALDDLGKPLAYGPGSRVTHADDHAILQAWLEWYQLDKDPAKLAPSIAHFDEFTKALAAETPKSISGGSFTWYSSDALFMSPPVWAHLSQLTGDPKFLEWADREWWTTNDVLYDPTHRLYYRDNRFFTQRTPSGKKVFSSHGNGWVVGGLIHMLNHLPEDHSAREKYLGLYHDMMHSLLKLQNADGLWRSSLLDPQEPQGESSGSSFFVGAMAWGIHRGLLPPESFKPAVMNGYLALTKNIQSSGAFGAAEPQDLTAQSRAVHDGPSAFLLAAAEVLRLLDPSKCQRDLTSFKRAALPQSFLPATPRTFARFIPEHSDDFAWENDLVAFRTQGPALRSSQEDSGIDCWFKRVRYPIVDKWYMENRLKLPCGNVNKPYHDDHGEGYDVYQVGGTRGCGGISVWHNGKLHNSDTFVAHRIIENTPERVSFELDFASELGGKTLRETRRITLIMGQRLFQSDSRFTLGSEPAKNLEVVIGLKPQAQSPRFSFSPKVGIMKLFENLDGYGLGTGIVIDPARVLKMTPHTDANGQTQALCFTRTDDAGGVRWFSGFGWEGQGGIASNEDWTTYLKSFAAKFIQSPFADPAKDPDFKVHTLDVPNSTQAPPTSQ